MSETVIKGKEKDKYIAGLFGINTQYGCHCELESLVQPAIPDGCVMDEGKDYDCVYAEGLRREGKNKHDCEEWKPVTGSEPDFTTPDGFFILWNIMKGQTSLFAFYSYLTCRALAYPLGEHSDPVYLLLPEIIDPVTFRDEVYEFFRRRGGCL